MGEFLLDTEVASRLMRAERTQGSNQFAPVGRQVHIDLKRHHGGIALWWAPSRGQAVRHGGRARVPQPHIGSSVG